MKLALLLCVISVSAFAQQKDKPVNYMDKVNPDILDFDWEKEVFKMWDCYCPWLRADSVQAMPRENSPYKWVNKEKPIIIDDSTYQQWIKSDIAFKKMYHRADSLQLKKKNPVSF
ncbi:MAG: hypothetical protein JSU09_16765 [Bacteroidetes bacterium]|nr:hypothetical protein [Bacteroidota bacterium]